jgi:hypothetical protein
MRQLNSLSKLCDLPPLRGQRMGAHMQLWVGLCGVRNLCGLCMEMGVHEVWLQGDTCALRLASLP